MPKLVKKKKQVVELQQPLLESDYEDIQVKQTVKVSFGDEQTLVDGQKDDSSKNLKKKNKNKFKKQKSKPKLDSDKVKAHVSITEQQ